MGDLLADACEGHSCSLGEDTGKAEQAQQRPAGEVRLGYVTNTWHELTLIPVFIPFMMCCLCTSSWGTSLQFQMEN